MFPLGLYKTLKPGSPPPQFLRGGSLLPIPPSAPRLGDQRARRAQAFCMTDQNTGPITTYPTRVGHGIAEVGSRNLPFYSLGENTSGPPPLHFEIGRGTPVQYEGPPIDSPPNNPLNNPLDSPDGQSGPTWREPPTNLPISL